MEWLQSLASHVAYLGLPAFVVLMLVLYVLPVPTWPLTIAAGALFGFWEGLGRSAIDAVRGSRV